MRGRLFVAGRVFAAACGGAPRGEGPEASPAGVGDAPPLASRPRGSAAPSPLLEGVTSVTRLAIASLCALPAVRSELDQLSAEDPAGGTPVALACEVDRVVLITGPGDSVSGLVVTRAPMAAWAQRVAVLRGTTLTWSGERRTRLDGGGDDWELRLVGEHLLAFWLADEPEGAIPGATEEDLAALVVAENDLLLESDERQRDGHRRVQILADLTALVDMSVETVPMNEWLEENRSRLLHERWLEDASPTLRIEGSSVHVETRANASQLATIPAMGAFMLSGRPLFGSM